MKDIQLTKDGDLYINENNDIEITDSVVQAIRIRLLWFWNEWRLGTQYGIPYFEEVLVKNPSVLRIKSRFRQAIMSVEEVRSIVSLELEMNNASRVAVIRYIAEIKDGRQISEEVSLGIE